MSKLSFTTQSGKIEIQCNASNWAKCYYSSDDSDAIYLGADDVEVILRRLLEWLSASEKPTVGKIEDNEVFWILSLSEAHFIFYGSYQRDGTTLFLWDAQTSASLEHSIQLTESERDTWKKQVEQMLRNIR